MNRASGMLWSVEAIDIETGAVALGFSSSGQGRQTATAVSAKGIRLFNEIEFVDPVPAALAQTTTRPAVAFGTGSLGIPSRILPLMEAGMNGATFSQAPIAWAGVCLAGILVGSADSVASQVRTAPTPESAPEVILTPASVAEKRTPVQDGKSCMDVYGDVLPVGAIVRMGTLRLRHDSPGGILSTAFSRDGRRLATGGWHDIRLWDAATGRMLRSIRDGHRTEFYCALLLRPTAAGWLGPEVSPSAFGIVPRGGCFTSFPRMANRSIVAQTASRSLLPRRTARFRYGISPAASKSRSLKQRRQPGPSRHDSPPTAGD